MLDGETATRFGVTGLRAAFDAGVDWMQLRDRSLDSDALLAVADRLGEAAQTASRSARVIVNRRVDVALAAGADGVHLGFDALPPREAHALLGNDAEIGVSLHAVAEIGRDPEATYAHLAPIFPPLSKPAERPTLGLAVLREAAERGVPIVAQGGIEVANAGAVVAAGAAGAAVTGFLSSAEDPGRAATALRSALDA